ncbi:16S rRNA methyltransferase [Candidatus Bathyarchaeota archaeon]|nr:16S rRNA methyltransferase [Candidatus Bathyarchaeota archaeon]
MSSLEPLEELTAQIRSSLKYRHVCIEIIRNLGSRELQKTGSLKKAIKATRKKLHQIAGAYFLTRPKYEEWMRKLRDAKKTGCPETFRKVCIEIMKHHHSTNMRLKNIDEFYNALFSKLPPVRSIADVACGFHPLAIPWMRLSSSTRYYAFDIYEDLMEFLKGFMSLAGVEGHAEARDIMQNPPQVKVNLAFILDTIPVLEQIEKGAGIRLLNMVKADYKVVSFPVKSLGGKDKGMRGYYESFFQRMPQKHWDFWKLETANELVYVIKSLK